MRLVNVRWGLWVTAVLGLVPGQVLSFILVGDYFPVRRQLRFSSFNGRSLNMSEVQKDGAERVTRLPTPAPSNALEFLRVVGKLKKLKRTGWVHRGVSLPESVSDHMYRMAMCAFLVTDPGLDRSRVMKLAIVHDLAEALAGDIAPFQNVSKEDKRRLEEEGLEKICATIGSNPIALEIKELWLEYEDCTSEEARMVKDLDKMEMIVQADEYERDQGKDLSEFFDSTGGVFTTSQVQSWDKELREQRNKRLRESSTSLKTKETPSSVSGL